MQPSPIEYARSRSQLAEGFLQVDGKPFSLNDYPMFKAIYDGPFDSMLLMTSRQVGKSTTLSTFSIGESMAIDHFHTYFISPSREQTHKFSTLRVGKMLKYSPELRDAYVGEADENRVNLRMFSNGSEIAFNYAMDDADRCRGYSCDRLLLDEVQDMLLDSVEPVVRECMSASDYKWIIRCGTPKTLENSIHAYWEASTMTEWVIKCDGCSKHTFIRSEKRLGKDGPTCHHCQKTLNPRNGQWIDMKPGSPIKGFHISRPMMPQSVPGAWTRSEDVDKARRAWTDIMDKYEGPRPYSLSKFRNEVLGVSDSQGRRIVTRADLEDACKGPPMQMKPGTELLKGVSMIAAGIDWSGGGVEVVSRTVIWVLGKLAKDYKFRTLYYKVFPGSSPVEELNEIESILGCMPNLALVACDAGEGNMPTEMLRKRIGPDKIMKIRYGSPKWHIKYDLEGRYHSVNRTWAIDSLMSALQRKEFEFPANVNAMTPAFDDILSEYEDVTSNGYKVWRHAPTQPDDCMHALNFARIAMQSALGQLDLTS